MEVWCPGLVREDKVRTGGVNRKKISFFKDRLARDFLNRGFSMRRKENVEAEIGGILLW